MAFAGVGLIVTVALNAAVMAMQAMRKIEGPRLADLTTTVADYGTPYNYFYGKRRFEVPCVYAEPIKEKKKKKKTKGGKYNEYTYFGTWALVIADHEIDAVLRVWFDRHLIYDVTGKGQRAPNPGDFDFEDALQAHDTSKNGFRTISQHMRIYLGTEDQLPDPRMQAKIEKKEGEGMCPALRGRAYIFFEDAPLEKFGNRMPQVSVEAVSTKDNDYSMDQLPIGGLHNQSISADLARLYTVFPRPNAGVLGNLQIWDLASRTMFYQTPMGAYQIDWPGSHLVTTLDGRIWHTTNFFSLVVRDQLGQNPRLVWTIPGGGGAYDLYWFIDSMGIEYIGAIPIGSGNIAWFNTVTEEAFEYDVDPFTFGRGPSGYFSDAYGDCWAVCAPTGGPLIEIVMVRIINKSGRSPLTTRIDLDVGIVGVSGACHVASEKHYFLNTDAGYIFIDDETFEIKDIKPNLGGGGWSSNPFNYSFWTAPGGDHVKEISLVTGKVLKDYDLYDWPTTDPHGFASAGTREEFYDPINHAWVSWYSPDSYGDQFRITWRYLDRLDSAGTTLQTIIEDVAERCGLPATNLDASLCTQQISGYSWTQGSGKQILEPLLEIYDTDVRPHNFKIEFKPRGSASLGTLSSEYFVREKSDDPPYETTLIGDSDLPHRIFLNFADVANDQQVNSAVARRSPDAIDSVRELTVDMSTWAATADEAQQKVERILRRRWFAREQFDLKLSAMQIALEPADVFNFDLEGIVVSARLMTNRIGANGVLQQKWERDVLALAVTSSSEGAPMAGRPPSVLLIPSQTQAFIMDVPLLSETDDVTTPFIYVAAGPFGQTVFWPGANIWMADTADGEFTPEWQGFENTEKATWGFVMTTLGDAVPDVLDNANTINVRVMHGVPSSATYDELIDDQNLNRAVIGSHQNGWEIIQFQTATLQPDGTYTLSGLIRGIQGTETQMGVHGAAELFLLVSADIKRHLMPVSEIGDTDYYQGYTNGRDKPLLTYEVEYNAAHLRPLSPAHLTLTRNTGTGDWTIAAQRRTRLGGNLVDGRDVPLGETSESYKLEIVDYDTVVATIAATALPIVYTAAQQVADFGLAQTELSVRLMQVSPALGIDGFPAEATA